MKIQISKSNTQLNSQAGNLLSNLNLLMDIILPVHLERNDKFRKKKNLLAKSPEDR